MASAASLKHRIFTLSHPSFNNENLELFRTILKKNGSPNDVINNLLTKTKHNTSNNSILNGRLSEETVHFYKFPYIDGISNKIQDVLRKHDIRLALYPLTKISQLYTNLKTKHKFRDICQVVYKLLGM